MMKRSIKKGIAFFLFLAMSLQLMVFSNPVTIHAEEANSDFVIYDDYLSDYTGKDKDLVIPADLGLTSIYISYNEYVETITIPEGVKNVSLYDIPKLNKINLSSTVSSVYLDSCSSIKELDFSDKNFDYIEIYNCEKLKKVTATGTNGSFYVSYCNNLTDIDVKGGKFNSFCVTSCPKVKNVVPESAEYVVYSNLSGIEKAVVPQDATSINLYNINFDKIVLEDNYAGFFIKDGGLYNDYDYDDETVDGKNRFLLGLDTTRKSINVIDGTKTIGYLELSGNCYTLEAITLPDSVEEISYGAFYGGESIKKLNIPKNIVTLGAYAFSGISADLVIPESVRYISDTTFLDYTGKLSVEKDTDAVETYNDGIYFNYIDKNTGEKTYSELMYYPYDKTSIEWKDGIDYIANGTFKYSKIKKLNIPEGVRYLSLDLRFANDLESISFPSTVWYIEPGTISSAPKLKTVSVSKNNNDYKSYKNCLYDKEMTTLLDAPVTITDFIIPEGVVSLGYYVITGHYFEDTDTYINPTVTLPRSASNNAFETYIDFKKLYIYADTELAGAYKDFNDSMMQYAEEGYDPYQYDYEFRDSNKDLLNLIYCVDQMTVKKGKKETAIVEAPLGMSFVSKLTKNKNTECKISFSSSDKSIAKVNSKTGVIKGIKKGTCTINVKCTLTNGKKTNTKKFKIKLKVK